MEANISGLDRHERLRKQIYLVSLSGRGDHRPVRYSFAFVMAIRDLISSWYRGVRPPADTSSRLVRESVTATHDFEVRNHQQLHGLGVGKYVSSSTFSAGGYHWNIRFYPDGYDQDCAGNVSAYLHCLDDLTKDVSTKFTLDVLENQVVEEAKGFGVQERTFTPMSAGMGIAKFIDKSRLKSPSHLGHAMKIRCVLTVEPEPGRKRKRDDIIMVPPPELSRHLERALRAGKGADVTFDVRGRVFAAHRFMLAARSPVFDAKLFDPERRTRDA